MVLSNSRAIGSKRSSTARQQPINAYAESILQAPEDLGRWCCLPSLILGELALGDTEPLRKFDLAGFKSTNLP